MWEEPQCIYVGMHMMTLETSGKTSRSIFYNFSQKYLVARKILQLQLFSATFL
jgi:hypothetical protein